MQPLTVSPTRIACTDAFTRERTVGLWTSPVSGCVVLVAPPAEAALLTPMQARALSNRLAELATVVEHQQVELIYASCGVTQ